MKVFISWSGEASNAAARALQKAIGNVFTNAEVWMSSEDIKLGQEWFTELIGALDGTRFAIVCLTRRNLASPWVMFEAGAVSGTFRDLRVVPVLLEGDISDLVDPLARFNGTRFTADGMRRLFESINDSLGSPLTQAAVHAVFDKQWKTLNATVQKALRRDPRYDVFLSVPMAAFGSDAAYQPFRAEAMKVVAALREGCALTVYCALERIASINDFDTFGEAAADDLAMLEQSANLVMLYPQRLPTSALFEAGFALARGLPCRFFVRDPSNDDHKLPYLMRKLPEVYSQVSIIDHTEWTTYEDIGNCLVRNRKRWFGQHLAAARKR